MLYRSLFAIGVIAISVFSIAEAADIAPSAKRGRDTYMKVGCYHCHGTVGQGSNAGLRLAPDPLPAESIAQFIRGTKGPMPAYSERILPDSDVADIAAYLKSIPAARSADSIPALTP
jgi:ubiquinol-cytochrome c reductase cytochrome c subunit